MNEKNGTDLKQQLAAARREKALLETQIQTKILKRQATLLESWQGYGTIYDPRDRGTFADDSWSPAASITSPQDRRGGRNWPIFDELRLNYYRQQSRLLCATNSHAKGLLRNLVNYTVGVGPTIKIVPREDLPDEQPDVPGYQPDVGAEKLAKVCQEIIDNFCDRNKMRWRIRELARRCKRDGEAFVRFFDVDQKLILRFVEPEMVLNPADATENTGWTFGIKHRVDEDGSEDVEDIIAYNVVHPYATSSQNGEEVTPDKILHIKNFDEDSTLKRGLPEFIFDTHDALMRAAEIQRSASEGQAMRESFAIITQHATATKDQVQDFSDSMADFTRTNPRTGRLENLKKIEGPQHVHIDKGQEFVAMPAGQGTSLATQISQGDLRQACSSVTAPEYFTGDASNGNYASLRESSAPILKNAEAEQQHYAEAVEYIVRRCLMMKQEYGDLPENLFDFVTVQVEMPLIVQRDRNQQAQENSTYMQMQVKSPQTIMMELGLDSAVEIANWQQWNDEMGGGGPDMGGLFGGGPSGGGGGGGGNGPAGGGDDLFGQSLEGLLEGFTGTVTDKLGRKRKYVNGKPVAGESGGSMGGDSGFGSGDTEQLAQLYQTSMKNPNATRDQIKQLATNADGAKIGEYQSLDPSGEYWTDGRSLYNGQMIGHFLTGNADYSPAKFGNLDDFVGAVSDLYNGWKAEADAVEFPAAEADAKQWWKKEKASPTWDRLRKANLPGGYYFHPSGWAVDVDNKRLIEPEKATKIKKRVQREYGTTESLMEGFTGTVTDKLGRKIHYQDGKRVASGEGDAPTAGKKSSVKDKVIGAAKALIAVSTAMPTLAKETMLKAGFSPAVANAAYLISVVGDYAVPGLPVVSAPVIILATIRKPSAPIAVVKDLIAKVRAMRSTPTSEWLMEALNQDDMMLIGQFLHEADDYEWAVTVLAVAMEDHEGDIAAAVDTARQVLEQNPEPPEQTTESDDEQERNESIAEILVHWLGDNAEDYLDAITESLLEEGKADGVYKDKRGHRYAIKGGKRVPLSQFLGDEPKKKNSKKDKQQSKEQAKQDVAKIMKGPKTPESAQKLVAALSKFTVAELNQFKKENSIKASGTKAALVQKIAERLKIGNGDKKAGPKPAKKASPKKTVPAKPAKEPTQTDVEKGDLSITDAIKPVPKESKLSPSQQLQFRSDMKKAFQRSLRMRQSESGYVSVAQLYDQLKMMGSNPDPDEIRYELSRMEENGEIYLHAHNGVHKEDPADLAKGAIKLGNTVYYFASLPK